MGYRNIVLLGFGQAVALCGPPMVLLVGGMVGMELAPTPTLATLPVSMLVIGLAIFSIPAAMIMKRTGRRRGFIGAALLASLAALLAAYAIYTASFFLFCLAVLLIGMNNAFVQQYRFAAAESVQAHQVGKAVSFVLIGGVVSGFLGPEIGKRARDLLDYGSYTGSFVILSILFLIVASLMVFLRDTVPAENQVDGPERPMLQIAIQPIFLTAVLAAGVAYGVMSFIMIATPIQMHKIDGFTLDATTLVIQSHIIAMFLPSFVSAFLIGKLGTLRMMWIGGAALAGCVFLNQVGQGFVHYWTALVLLGIGWNFLFVSGTALLTRSYRPAERFKAQAANDFIIFGVQAAASLGAGSVLAQADWQSLNLMTLPALLMLAAALIVLQRRTTLFVIAPESP